MASCALSHSYKSQMVRQLLLRTYDDLLACRYSSTLLSCRVFAGCGGRGGVRAKQLGICSMSELREPYHCRQLTQNVLACVLSDCACPICSCYDTVSKERRRSETGPHLLKCSPVPESHPASCAPRVIWRGGVVRWQVAGRNDLAALAYIRPVYRAAVLLYPRERVSLAQSVSGQLGV